MKKKFVLTMALVLMVAVSLSAATPVEMSGEFNVSHEFTFDPVATISVTEFELNKLSVSGDFWKISIGGGPLDFGNPTAQGVADIYLSKALAEQGVDMGDISLTLSVGNLGTTGMLSVYDDPNDSFDNNARFRMNGISPATTALTVGYADMVTVKGAFNLSAGVPFMISAKVAPVDGVMATVGFTNDVVGDPAGKGSIGGSVKVDVAALADLDFDLYASALDFYFLDSKNNVLFATLGGGYADINLNAELVMDKATTNDLTLKASYAGIENVGLSAKVKLVDLSDIKTTISGAVDYTMGGVKYKLGAGYAVDAEVFTLTPSVTIKF